MKPHRITLALDRFTRRPRSAAGRVFKLAARIPDVFKRVSKHRVPNTMIDARTGDAKYAPTARYGRNDKGIRIVLAHRLDDVSVRDYDRIRFYPAIVDGIRSLVVPAARANVHFTCDDPNIAELAQQELGPLVPSFIKNALRGGFHFGYHACSPRWVPKFDVIVSSGQKQGANAEGSVSERHYPFIWTVSRFHNFHPADTRILIDSVTGNFAGIRQFIPAGTRSQDVLAKNARVLIWTHNREYDYHHGIPLTKPALPFVEVAEMVWDSVAIYAELYAVPGMIGKYPMGSQPNGVDDDGKPVKIENSSVMQSLLEGIGRGERISMPSDYHESGNPKWMIDFFQPAGNTEPYTAILDALHDQIRLALGVTDQAMSESQKVGGLGDGGTEDKIQLHLANIEGYLDELKPELDRLCDAFRIFNFGADAPPLRVFFEPVDLNVTKALLAAVVEILSSGQPIQDAEGNLIYPDWGKILQDKGIPTVSVSGKRLAQQLLDAANKQIGEKRAQSNGQDPEAGMGGAPGDQVVNSLTPKVAAGDRAAAVALLQRSIDLIDTAPAIKVRLKDLLLGEWEESKHPRGKDGKFAKGAGGEGAPTDEGGGRPEIDSEEVDPAGSGAQPGMLDYSDSGYPKSHPMEPVRTAYKRRPAPAHWQGTPEEWESMQDRQESRVKAASEVPSELEVAVGPEKPGENLERVTAVDTPELMRARRAISEYAADKSPTVEEETPERLELRRSVASDLYGAGAAKKERKVHVIMGPPGSGKSTLIRDAGLTDPEGLGALEIDSDMAKEQLPEFAGGRLGYLVHEESSDIGQAVQDRAMEAGDNIVLPLIGKSSDKMAAMVQDFLDAGYEITVHNITMPTQRSAESCVARFHRTGRFVPPEYALSVDAKPSETYRKLYEQYGDRVRFNEVSSDELQKRRKDR